MKPSRLYLNLDDFSNRFKDTFIYYQGVAKYVFNCSMLDHDDRETYSFNVLPFKEGLDVGQRTNSILLNDEEVNFRDYNIGYVHTNDYYSLWSARAPSRQWKQGLRRDQCQFTGNYSEDDENSDALGPNRYTYNMLMNSYPTVEMAIDKMRTTFVSRNCKLAINKNFALLNTRNSKDLAIEYKGLIVSNYEPKPQLVKEFRYLLNVPEYSKLLSAL